MYFPTNLLVIDVEATGVDPMSAYSICQIGAVLVCKQTLTIIKSFGSYVKPLEATRRPKSMMVHQIPEEVLLNAPSLEPVLEKVEALTDPKSVQFAAWGVSFDAGFLRVQYEKINRNCPFYRRCVDLKSIVMWEMCKRGLKPKSWGLKNVSKRLQLPIDGKHHDALDDAIQTVRVLAYFGRS